jgi:hypothetical protein
MLMKKISLARRVMISFVLISFFASITACYGPFNMTRNVYHWNSGIKGSGEVNEKWMKEIVFFGMLVIPVYMFSALLDAFVFNAIQFWSGDNPIKLTQDVNGHIQEVQLGDTTIGISWSEDRRSAALVYRQQGRITKTANIVEQGTGFRLVEHSGSSVYVGEVSPDGSLTIVDHDCRLVDRVSSAGVLNGAWYLAQGFRSEDFF